MRRVLLESFAKVDFHFMAVEKFRISHDLLMEHVEPSITTHVVFALNVKSNG